MESRSKLNRVKNSKNYFEQHHIIPRSLGGSNRPDNLVLLTAREHFIAHLLLPRFLKGKDKKSMLFAIVMMGSTSKNKINSFLYDKIKKKFSVSMSNRIISQETRDKLSKSTKKRLAEPENNPMYGHIYSQETRDKMSDSWSDKRKKEASIRRATYNSQNYSGENNPFYGKDHSNVVKAKISKANKGKKISQSHKDAVSKALKGKIRPRGLCPNCGKTGSLANMKPYHFDNCPQIR